MDHIVALKNEQTARIVMRDTSLYVFLVTVFAVHAAEGQVGSNTALLDLIQTCSTALSAIMLSIYLSNDYYVSKIGAFIRMDPGAEEFHQWEAFHRFGWRHHAQKLFRTFFVVILFGGWAFYQGHAVLQSEDIVARGAAIIFCVVVTLQILFFLTFAFDGASLQSKKIDEP